MSNAGKAQQIKLPVAYGSSAAIAKDKLELAKALWILGSATIVLGSVLLAAMIYQFGRADDSQSWLETEGSIASERIVRQKVGEGSRRSWTYLPKVMYTYWVDGQRYTGTKYTIGAGIEGFPSEFQARKFLQTNYPKGANVTVYYNPDQPGDAVLLRGGGSNLKWITIAAVAILLAGLWLIARAVLARRTARKLTLVPA